MTKSQLWKIFTEKNPHWLEDGANFSAAGLEKFFGEIWKHAEKNGVAVGVDKESRRAKAVDDMMNRAKDPELTGDQAQAFTDIFGDIFGDTHGKK